MVDTESTEVHEAVQALFALLLDAGAWVNPHLRIVERAGQISVWSEADDPWLMRIPKHTIVPVADINWPNEPPLRIEGLPSSLSSIQQEVLNACVDVMAAHHTWEHRLTTDLRAAAESAAIRVALGLAPEVDGAFGILAHRMIRASVQVGAIIDAETVTALVRRDQLPEEIIKYLESIVLDANNQTITLRSFVDAEYDEIVIAIPQSVMIRPVVQFVEDVVLQTEANMESTIITIRRPTHRAG